MSAGIQPSGRTTIVSALAVLACSALATCVNPQPAPAAQERTVAEQVAVRCYAYRADRADGLIQVNQLAERVCGERGL